MNILPKSPEQIMKEFESYTSEQPKDGVYLVSIFSQKAWLSSSLASLLCYMAERMKLPCDDEVFYDKDGNSFSNPRTLLIEEAGKITEV